MPRGVAGTILKLLIASLVVGFVLSALGITPASILARMGGTLRGAFEATASLFSGTFEYILLGAMLVVPVWLVVVLVKSARK
jgi:hypothetical protein